MQYPTLSPSKQTRIVTDVFTGYDHRPRTADGAFYNTENLSSRQYPLLCTRERRGLVTTLEAPGGLLGKDALCYVDDGTLYVNGLATAVTGLASGEKQLVSMGAYVLIFPDKVYYNTEDASDHGSMEASYTSIGSVSYAPCRADGSLYSIDTSGDMEPDTPENGALWLDTGDGGMTLRQYSASQACWVEIPEVYTRIGFASQGSVPALFKAYDGVTITGAHYEALNGDKILYALGGAANSTADYIVVVGLIGAGSTETTGSVTVSRSVPTMDFVCEAQNRLWGCRYGNDGTKNLNEIYASALGDFKNFRQYLGLSTDSWTASVGSDGVWTGAVNYLGRPCFFKENRIHQVTVSATGAHRLDEIVCRGVQKGSDKSLQVVGERLYYKSGDGVCVWQGGFPQTVGAALGETAYEKAVAGSVDGRYYLSMQESASGDWSLFCYDTERGVWYREDALHILCFARAGGELYAVDAASGALLALKGSVGTAEASLPWMAETGLLGYQTPDRKYVSRYTLTLRMEEGASVRLWLRYDSTGAWQKSGEVQLSVNGSVTIPIRPRRCDHMQLRIEGEGEVKIRALTRVLETGSDL